LAPLSATSRFLPLMTAGTTAEPTAWRSAGVRPKSASYCSIFSAVLSAMMDPAGTSPSQSHVTSIEFSGSAAVEDDDEEDDDDQEKEEEEEEEEEEQEEDDDAEDDAAASVAVAVV